MGNKSVVVNNNARKTNEENSKTTKLLKGIDRISK